MLVQIHADYKMLVNFGGGHGQKNGCGQSALVTGL